MMSNEMQKLGQDSMDTALSSMAAWTKNTQAIAVEVGDYLKKSLEGSAAAWEKLLTAKSLDKAAEIQSEYVKSSYEDFVAKASKISELYVDLAKAAYKPFEGVVAKASVMK